jgi:two-component system, cell cycle response regulator
MAREVAAREDRLKQQVQALPIEIDHTRKSRAVDEVVGTEYFQQLQQRAMHLRNWHF